MRAPRAVLCIVLIPTFLVGCTNTSDNPENPGPGGPSIPSEGESAMSRGTRTGKASAAEADVAALTDLRGNGLQIVSPDVTREGFEAASAVLEGVSVQPAECSAVAARNAGSVNQFAGEGVIGAGVADEQGSVLSAGLLDGSRVTGPAGDFEGTRAQLQRCASFTVSGATLTTVEEIPQDPIADASYAVLITQQLGAGQFQYTLSVNARSNDLIASVQSVGTVEPDGVLQDELADLATQLLESPAS